MFAAVHESGYVQVFGRRQDAVSTCSDGRRPKSAKARNRVGRQGRSSVHAVALCLLQRTGDKGLKAAAEQLSKW